MPECSICGREVSEIIKIEVEGSILEVCETCLVYGQKIEEPRVVKKRRRVKKPTEETLLIENYGDVIIDARKKKDLRREEFAQKINEKESVIRRVEMQEMTPNDLLVKKIENFLGIKLRTTYEEVPVREKTKSKELTLGDVVELE